MGFSTPTLLIFVLESCYRTPFSAVLGDLDHESKTLLLSLSLPHSLPLAPSRAFLELASFLASQTCGGWRFIYDLKERSVKYDSDANNIMSHSPRVEITRWYLFEKRRQVHYLSTRRRCVLRFQAFFVLFIEQFPPPRMT